MQILSKNEIKRLFQFLKFLNAIELGFIAYSHGKTVIPSIPLHFDSPPGDCHIKYGYTKSGKYYVVKIAFGFYDNPK